MKNWIRSTFGRFVLSSALLSIFFSILLYTQIDKPKEIIDVLYWWISVVTTVGVNNLIADSTIAKLFASLSMFFGAILYFAIISELVLWTKRKSDQRLKGYKKYTGTNHIIIAGYNTMAYGLIHLIDKIVLTEIDIILVTDKLESNPFPERVRFIKSSPSILSSLEAANISAATISFVLSDDKEEKGKADLNTILTGGIIEENSPNVFTIVELTAEHTKQKEVDAFNIDKTLSYKSILEMIKDKKKAKKMFNNVPKSIKDKILKEEYR